MEKLKQYRKKALIQYEDLRDTIAVIEAMHFQGNKTGIAWSYLKNKLHARNN